MQEINIFNIVPQKFFTILSSPNKILHMKIISIIFMSMQNGLSYGVDKDILVDEIEDYLNSTDIVIVSDENDVYEIASNNRDRANNIIRKLTECGWIYLESTNDYKQIINFHDYSITLLESFVKIVNKESIEYQGNIISIYNMLYSDAKPYVIIKHIFDNTKGIITSLKKLNSNIKKYMDRLTKQKKPEEIMEEFFGNYISEVIDKSYHRLKTSENISRYRPKIIEKLTNNLSDEEFLTSAGKVIFEDEQMNSLEDGIEKVKEMIESIIEAFNNLDDIIHDIDSKNSKYIKAAVTRAKFILNNSRDITGILKSILEYVSIQYNELELNLSNDYLEEITDMFTLYSYGYIDESSLYAANEGKKSFKPEKIKKTSISKEEREKRFNEFKEKQKNRYSQKKVNEIVVSLLKDKISIEAKNLEISSIEDFIKIIYIRIYGNNILAKYIVKRRKDIVIKNGFSFRNFEIWRK